MSLIGWLTAFVSDTKIALVEEGTLLGTRQLDMGNSGLIMVMPAAKDEGKIARLSTISRILHRDVGRSNMRKSQTGTVFSAVGRIQNDQSGITGLETAIVLIAFIVVAAVFAFTVLTTGLFTTERARETTMSALGEAQSTLAPKGAIVGEARTTVVDTIKFKLANATGAVGVDLASDTTLLTYTDDSQTVNAAFLATSGDPNDQFSACAGQGAQVCWKTIWVLGSGDTIDGGEIVEFTVDLTALTTKLSSNTRFKIEVIPSTGAVVPISRTTPLEIKSVMSLD